MVSSIHVSQTSLKRLMKKSIKTKICKVCGTEFKPQNSFQKVCSAVCALTLVRQQKSKEKRQKQKAFKRKCNVEKREFNKRDIRWQHKQTQKAFNKMRVLQELEWFRQRGLEPTCISCGKPKGNDQWACGHKKTQGGNSRLRYDEKNTFLQHNYSCNMQKSGDIEGYEKGLIERFGEEEGKALIEYQNSNTHDKKWTCEELEEMRKKFNVEIRRLEKQMQDIAA